MSFCFQSSCRGGHSSTDNSLCVSIRPELLRHLISTAEAAEAVQVMTLTYEELAEAQELLE